MVETIKMVKRGATYGVYINGNEVVTLEYMDVENIFKYARRIVDDKWDRAETKSQDTYEYERMATELTTIIHAIHEEREV